MKIYSISLLFCACLLCSCDVTQLNADTASDEQTGGLHTSADFPVGGAIDIRKVMRDSQLRAIVQREFNSVTSTNDMKMYRIARDPGPLNFSRADSVVAFAQANDLRVFGHALVWHYALPDHIAEMSADEMRGFLATYVDSVVTRYRGEIDGWDVVNEGTDNEGRRYARLPLLPATRP